MNHEKEEIKSDMATTHSINIEAKGKFSGCFSGLKDSKISRLHTFLFFLKRFLQCFILFILKDINQDAKIGLFFGLQIIFFVFYLRVKPHKLTKDQLIEIINEFIYILLMFRLFYVSNQEDWTNAEKHSFLSLIVANFLIQTGISLCKHFRQ